MRRCALTVWLVIGYGSPLNGDDRFGLCVAEQLQERIDDDRVEILTAHQLTPDLIEPLSLARAAIFVDASTNVQVGELRCIPLSTSTTARDDLLAAGSNSSSSTISHHLTPESLLDATFAVCGRSPQSWLYSAGGTDFTLSESLSQAMSAIVASAVSLIQEQVKHDP